MGRLRSGLRLLAAASLAAGSVVAAVPAGAQAPTQCLGRDATIVGTQASDVIRGTEDNDVIIARGGSDRIRALDGRDRVCAGKGVDVVRGGDGTDIVRAGDGADDIKGNRGRPVHLGRQRGRRHRLFVLE